MVSKEKTHSLFERLSFSTMAHPVALVPIRRGQSSSDAYVNKEKLMSKGKQTRFDLSSTAITTKTSRIMSAKSNTAATCRIVSHPTISASTTTETSSKPNDFKLTSGVKEEIKEKTNKDLHPRRNGRENDVHLANNIALLSFAQREHYRLQLEWRGTDPTRPPKDAPSSNLSTIPPPLLSREGDKSFPTRKSGLKQHVSAPAKFVIQ